MVRSRRELHHSDGITDQKSLQRTSATKSALNCRAGRRQPRQLLGVKRTSQFDRAAAANDPQRTSGNYAVTGILNSSKAAREAASTWHWDHLPTRSIMPQNM